MTDWLTGLYMIPVLHSLGLHDSTRHDGRDMSNLQCFWMKYVDSRPMLVWDVGTRDPALATNPGSGRGVQV